MLRKTMAVGPCDEPAVTGYTGVASHRVCCAQGLASPRDRRGRRGRIAAGSRRAMAGAGLDVRGRSVRKEGRIWGDGGMEGWRGDRTRHRTRQQERGTDIEAIGQSEEEYSMGHPARHPGLLMVLVCDGGEGSGEGRARSQMAPSRTQPFGPSRETHTRTFGAIGMPRPGFAISASTIDPCACLGVNAANREPRIDIPCLSWTNPGFRIFGAVRHMVWR